MADGPAQNNRPRVGIAVSVYNIARFEKGGVNPGIGGSQYMPLVLAGLLSEQHDVTLFTTEPLDYPGVKVEPIEAVANLKPDDVLIAPLGLMNRVVSSPARLIAWMHNTLNPELDTVADRLEGIICLTPQQFDLLRWHKASDKMWVIPHPIDVDHYAYSPTFDDHIVYLGALVDAKGFHHYARFMGDVLKGRRTRLLVIGGSATYGLGSEGALGVTSADYEDTFIEAVRPFLPSRQIEFLGNLGEEKLDIMRRAKLGLTNPTGKSETFCSSNIEFMAMGTPVIGGYHKGMTYTLYRDRRLNLQTTDQIPGKLNRLLDDEQTLSDLRPQVRAFAKDLCSPDRVAGLWGDLIARRPRPVHGLSQPFLDGPKLPIYVASSLGLRLTFKQLLRGLSVLN